MRAKEARRLRPGDQIRATFGTVTRPAQVLRIEWPYVWVTTILKSGEKRVQRSRYQSVYPACR